MVIPHGFWRGSAFHLAFLWLWGQMSFKGCVCLEFGFVLLAGDEGRSERQDVVLTSSGVLTPVWQCRTLFSREPLATMLTSCCDPQAEEILGSVVSMLRMGSVVWEGSWVGSCFIFLDSNGTSL